MPSARETSGATTHLTLSYVRDHGGDAAVDAVLARAAMPHSAEDLERSSTWISYDDRIRLFEAVVEVLGEPDAMFNVGATSLRPNVNQALVLLLRALGSPRDVYSQLPRSVPKFTTTSSMQVLEVGDHHAVIDYVLHDGYEHSRLDCGYAQGLFTVVPEIFGLPPATIVHERCQSDGHPSCVYAVEWTPRSRSPWRRRRELRKALGLEVGSLRSQLTALQSAASDLVSSDDLSTVLDRVADRAATAVIAQAYLLVVEDPYGGPPLVRAAGLPDERVARLAPRLLAGGDLGPAAVVADVASARRHHGRLAAIYGEGQRGPAAERTLLAAYARHAAAALDTFLAAEDARRGEERATALLRLATGLVGTSSADEVGEVVAAALPGVAGVDRVTVYLWDDDAQALRLAASAGLEPEQHAAIADARITADASPTLATMLGDPRPQLLRADIGEPLLRALLEATGTPQTAITPMLHDGRLLGVLSTEWPGEEGTPAFDELTGRLAGVANQAVNALLNAELVATVRHQSLHDGLTALPNRELFSDRAGRAGAGDRPVALLFCDLDRFKKVNDTLGHAAGDDLLRQVADRLRRCVRGHDTVARLSGDEFAVLLPDVADGEEARRVADRIVAALSRPFTIGGHEVLVTASIGVAYAPEGGVEADALLREADEAMYEAKRRGRNQVARLATPAACPSPGTLSLEAELAAALEEDALDVAFQPLVDLDTGRTTGHEALVRWRHPEHGLLLPGAFVPLAEACGLVVALDFAVLRRAVHATAERHAAGEPLRVSVNLSRPTLADPRLPGAVREALEDSGLPAGALELEVTENAVGTDPDAVEARLVELKRIGVRLALDDFGTGQSGISWLHRFPVDRVKIDRAFVASAGTERVARAVVDAVVCLGRGLGIDVLAEGVETEAQRQVLLEAGCRSGQGWLFGRPELAPAEPIAHR